MKLIDVVCPSGHIQFDVFVKTLDKSAYPLCACLVTRTKRCGQQTERAWLSAPSITPQGTRPERNTDRPPSPAKVNTQAIALETTREIEAKWTRYRDPKLAEQHVSREINHKAGIADEVGNTIPIPKPAPFQVTKPKISPRPA